MEHVIINEKFSQIKICTIDYDGLHALIIKFNNCVRNKNLYKCNITY